MLSIVTAVLSAFLDNVTTALLVAPVTLFIIVTGVGHAGLLQILGV